MTGRECDGTLQRERIFSVKQGGTAGIRLSLSEDRRILFYSLRQFAETPDILDTQKRKESSVRGDTGQQNKGHPLAERKAVSLEETLPYPQIYFAKGSGIRNVVDRLFEDIEAKPQISCENEEDQVIAGLVAGGFGIAVVPYMDMLMKLDISILEIEYPPYRREFFMVQNNDAYLSPAAAAFRDFVADRK